MRPSQSSTIIPATVMGGGARFNQNPKKQQGYSMLTTGIALILALGITCPATLQAEAATVLDCHVLFSSPSDLGYTFSWNTARRDAAERFRQNYPQHTLTSYYVTGGIGQNRFDVYDRLVAKGCQIINEGVYGWSNVTEVYAAKFPNVTFVAHNIWNRASTASNLVMFGTRSYQPWFLMGVALASEMKRCVAMVTAWYSRAGEITNAVNAITLGMRQVDPSATINIVPMESWYSPTRELEAAEALKDQLDCDIIGRFTDPSTVNEYISKNFDGEAFSFSTHANTIEYQGDSVLASVYTDYTDLFYNLTVTVAEGSSLAPLTRWLTVASGATVLSTLSPRASALTQARVADYRQGFVNGSIDTFCRELVALNGTVVQSAGNCLTDDQIRRANRDIGYLQGVKVHDRYEYGATECAPGQYYQHLIDPADGVLKLNCYPCPANTFTEEASRGSCNACPVDHKSGPGSTKCEFDGLRSWEVMLIILGCFLFVAIVLFVVVIMKLTSNVRNTSSAPKDGSKPFAVMFTDIQSSTMLWSKFPEAMGPALDEHHRMIRELIDKHECYEVKTIGDAFMITSQDPNAILSLALDLQEKFFRFDWGTDEFDDLYKSMEEEDYATSSDVKIADLQADYEHRWNGLRVRCGMHFGMGDIQFDEIAKGYDYYGTVVNTGARVESKAFGGQVVMSEDFMKASGCATANCLSLGQHELKGVTGKVQLFQHQCLGRLHPKLSSGTNAEQAFEIEVEGGESASHVSSRSKHANPDQLEHQFVSRNPACASRLLSIQQAIHLAFTGISGPKKNQALSILCNRWRVEARNLERDSAAERSIWLLSERLARITNTTNQHTLLAGDEMTSRRSSMHSRVSKNPAPEPQPPVAITVNNTNNDCEPSQSSLLVPAQPGQVIAPGEESSNAAQKKEEAAEKYSAPTPGGPNESQS